MKGGIRLSIEARRLQSMLKLGLRLLLGLWLYVMGYS